MISPPPPPARCRVPCRYDDVGSELKALRSANETCMAEVAELRSELGEATAGMQQLAEDNTALKVKLDAQAVDFQGKLDQQQKDHNAALKGVLAKASASLTTSRAACPAVTVCQLRLPRACVHAVVVVVVC